MNPCTRSIMFCTCLLSNIAAAQMPPPGPPPMAPGPAPHAAPGQTVSTLPGGNVPIRWRGEQFFMANGYFYTRSSGGYVVTSPPIGLRVPSLPAGATPVEGSRDRRYRYGGVVYEKQGSRWEVIASN